MLEFQVRLEVPAGSLGNGRGARHVYHDLVGQYTIFREKKVCGDPLIFISSVERDLFLYPVFRLSVLPFYIRVKVGLVVVELLFVELKDRIRHRRFLVEIGSFAQLLSRKYGGGDLIGIKVENASKTVFVGAVKRRCLTPVTKHIYGVIQESVLGLKRRVVSYSQERNDHLCR